MSKDSLSFSGSWQGISAGGCFEYASWRYNPQLFVRSQTPCKITIFLSQERAKDLFEIGLYVAKADGSGYRVLQVDEVLTSSGFSAQREVSCSVELLDVTLPLVVIPCTRRPEQECDFRLRFDSSSPVTVLPVDPELAHRMYSQAGKWESGSAGGGRAHPTVCNNPQFSLELEKATTVTVTLSQTLKEPFDRIGIYVCKAKAGSKISSSAADLGPGLSPVVRPKSEKSSSSSSSSSGGKVARLKTISTKQLVAKSEFLSSKEASVTFKAAPKYTYTIIPCTQDPNHESTFSLTCFAKRRLKLKSLNQEASDIEVAGQWHDESAGGCVNFPTWRNNPQYFLYAKRPFTTVQITLTQKRSFEPFAIGVYVARNPDNAQSRLLVLSADNLVTKTSFEKAREVSTTVVLEDTETPYAIIPATFYQNQASKFSLNVRVLSVKGAREGVPIKAATVLNLLPCTFLWNQRTMNSRWTEQESGGCRNHATWLHNPQVSLKLGQESKVVVILAVKDAKDSIGLYLLKDSRSINQSQRVEDSEAGMVEIVGKSVFRKEEEISLECTLDKGVYKLLPTTFQPGVMKEFALTIYCDTDKFSSNLCFDDSKRHSEKLTQAGGSSSNLMSLTPDKWRIRFEDIRVDESNLLGQGGYGVVYKGVYNGRTVAVKKMLVELMEESDMLVFKKEISIMDMYAHPNIVEFIGANLVPPSICIVTEYCGKGNLSKVLKLEKDLSWNVKLQIAVQVSSGMSYLHAQNPPVVHRDLKSLNILICDDYTAKLCDFGLSKTTSGSSLNSCVGSLNWCAPEVLLRNDPFTKYADVYSMGMVLLELYTHKPPFEGMQPLQIVKAIDSGTLLPIPTAAPRAYGLLIRRCWDFVPKNRPAFALVEKDLLAISPSSFPKSK